MNQSIERLLPAPCVCQKTPSCLLAGRADPLERLHRRVHPEVLVVARERLDEAARLLAVGDEALDEIEQARRLARPPDRRLELDAAARPLGVDPLPLPELLPRSERRADPRLRAVREDHERVRPEELRDRVAVVA